MKKIAFLLTFLTFSILQNCYSQDKGHIAISLGPSFPTGDFASKDIDNSSAGWANSGAIFDITFAYKLKPQFGLTAMLRGQANPIDAQALADEYANQIPDVTWTVESQSWSIGGLMFGGYGSFSLSEKTSLEPRLLIGFLNATSPEIKVTASDQSNSMWFKQNSTSGSAFAYLLGAGFKFDVGKRICLLTNLDYLGAKPEFKNVESTSSLGTSSKDTYSQSFGAINIGLGIGYRL